MAMNVDNLINGLDHNFKDINGRTIHVGDIIMISSWNSGYFGNIYYLNKGIVLKFYDKKFEYISIENIEKMEDVEHKTYCMRSAETVMVINEMYKDEYERYLKKIPEFLEMRDEKKDKKKKTKYITTFLYKDKTDCGFLCLRENIETPYMKKSDKISIEKKLNEKYPDYKIAFLTKDDKFENSESIKQTDIRMYSDGYTYTNLIGYIPKNMCDHFIKCNMDWKVHGNSTMTDIETNVVLDFNRHGLVWWWTKIFNNVELLFV